MTALVQAELLKLRTTRTALGFLVAAVILTLLLLILNLSLSDINDEDSVRGALAGAGIVTSLLLVFGIVATTGEHRHRTITSSVLSVPDRLRLVIAKLIAVFVAGLILGLAAMIVSFVVGLPWLDSKPGSPSLPTEDYLQLLVGGTLAAALFGALGVGLGSLVKNQAAAVVTALVWVFVLEGTLDALISNDVSRFLLSPASVSLAVGGPDADMSWYAGGVVLVAWVLVFAVAGAIAERERDIE